MAEVIREINGCRLCGSAKLENLLFLGNQYVSDFVTSTGANPRAPLELVRCKSCGLVQLKHTFSRASLYYHYWYKSGISPTMRRALEELVRRASEAARLASGDIVLDIGCNDGTLLRSYNRSDLFLVGFEPAENLIPEAEKGTNWIFNDFFSADIFKSKFGVRKAKIITSVAMFYDIDDPNKFVNDITQILAPEGVWVVQQNYLATMLEQNGFDNIGHEHLEYYSLATMQELLQRHELEVFDVETNDVNGGSFRTLICHRGKYPVEASVAAMRERETHLGLDKHETYKQFARRIGQIKSEVHGFVSSEVKKGKTVYVYGASNRGNTILQYCDLDKTLIRKATDANPEKWGKKTVGTQIPIVSKEEARKDRPDYFLVLPHHFLEEIVSDEQSYLRTGGILIVLLPEFRLITDKSVSSQSQQVS